MSGKDPGGWQGERGSTTERGYGYAWQKQRQRTLRRDNGLCRPCRAKGKATIATAVDHILNKAEAAAAGVRWDADENTQSICDGCHDDKTQAEAQRARGVEPKPQIGLDGWPIE